MTQRKTPIVENEVYHIYTRSIAAYKIFRYENDYKRIIDTINFYRVEKPPYKFSVFTNLFKESKEDRLSEIRNSKKIVKILSYCIMPTHIHLILQQLTDGGISKFINLVLKSYSKYFNIKYDRLGPLWEGRFKNVLVETDEQLLHLSRYVHLNPVSASLVNNPLEWRYSSYKEYLKLIPEENMICDFFGYIEITPSIYKEFVNEHITHQRELEKIKHITLE